MSGWLVVAAVVAVLVLFVILKSIHRIGPTEVGLVIKRYGLRKLADDNPIAFNGEAGYQADLLMPGLRVQALAGLHGPASTRGCRCRPARSASSSPRSARPLPIGAKSAALPAGVRQLLRPPRRSSPAAARRACSARCCLRARSCRSTRSRSS